MFVGIFIGVWVARYLGPEEFGLYQYAHAFVALFLVISTLGLDEIVTRELVKDESKRDKLLGTAFSLKLAGAFSVIFFLFIAVNLTSNDSQTNTLIFIIASVTIFQSFNVIEFFFQSKILSRYVVYANSCSLAISSTLKIIFIVKGAPLIDFAIVVLIESFLLACSFIYFYFRMNLSFRKWYFDSILALSLLKDSWPLILSGIVISIYLKVDQVMIKEMLGSSDVGQYSAAVRLSQGWYFIPMVISTSLFPAIVNAKKQSEELYYSRLQGLYSLMVWMAIAIALPMSFLSGWVVDLLFGSEYNQAGGVLMIHIWAGVFSFFGTARSKWIIIENLQEAGLYYTLFGGIMNVLLNLVLIPASGINGAAIATIISVIFIVLIFPLFHKKIRPSVGMFFKVFKLKSND